MGNPVNHPLAMAIFLCAVIGSPGEAPSLQSLVRQAPAVEAALRRMDAAMVRATSAGRWADPELEGMYARKEMPMERMPMWSASLQQPLPKWGERSAERARARAALDMARADSELMAGEIAMAAAGALAEFDAAQQRTSLQERLLERTQRVKASTDARLGAGQGRLSESLALQSRVTELQLAIDREKRRAADAEAAVRQQLGLDVSAALPAFDAPDADGIRIDAAPGVRLLEAQKLEADAMGAMARVSARPMTAIRVSFEREEAESGDEDTAGVALMTELPWNSRRYARADVQAAIAERAGRDAEVDVLHRKIEADRARVARLEAFATRTREVVRETRGRVEREYEALITASGATGMQEASSLLMLLELMDRDTELEMQRIEAETDARMARAELWRYQPLLTGEPHE